MRALLVLAVAIPALAGCTPYIPVKPGFGTSALVAKGEIPPEFVEFNNFDPAINRLLGDQICATPYQLYEDKGVAAAPGLMVQAYGRCRNHVPLFGE